jgi:hypothetical protein
MIEISVFFDKLDDFSINAMCFLIKQSRSISSLQNKLFLSYLEKDQRYHQI